MNRVYDEFHSPIGLLRIVLDDAGVQKLFLTAQGWDEYCSETGELVKDPMYCREVTRELAEYFAGKRQTFSVPLSISGTDFQQKVWQALRSIPYGQTRCYGDIAAAIGRPKAPRAVGQANHQNPLPIFIPCHRVIGKTGALTGYLGDHIEMKRYLLKMETRFKNNL